MAARRELYNGMDGVHIALIYSPDEDGENEFLHIHVTYMYLKRYLPHRIISFIMLGIKANELVSDSHQIEFYNGFVSLLEYDFLVVPMIKGQPGKLIYNRKDGFVRQYRFQCGVFQHTLTQQERVELSDDYAEKVRSKPTSCFSQAPSFYGAFKTTDHENFIPLPKTTIPLRFLQGKSDICAYASLASAMFFYSRKVQSRKALILQDIWYGLEHLSNTHPPTLHHVFVLFLAISIDKLS